MLTHRFRTIIEPEMMLKTYGPRNPARRGGISFHDRQPAFRPAFSAELVDV